MHRMITMSMLVIIGSLASSSVPPMPLITSPSLPR